MKKWLATLLAFGVLTFALIGCGGAGIGGILALIEAGDVVADIGEDLFGDDGGDGTAQVFLDGQPITEISQNDTEVELRDLPEGRHRLHVVASDTRGAAPIINVEPDRATEIDPPQPFDGGQIRGSVRLEEADDTTSNAASVLVYAIPDGEQVVLDDDALSLPGDAPPCAAYTGTGGNFHLRALPKNDYLVIATVAGYGADIQFIDLNEDPTPEPFELTLQADRDADAGRVTGVVMDENDAGLRNASLRAQLAGDPYVPEIPQDAANTVLEEIFGDAAGRRLPEFQFEVLATLTDEGGSYRLPLMPGAREINCFAFGFKPALESANVVAGQTTPNTNFELED